MENKIDKYALLEFIRLQNPKKILQACDVVDACRSEEHPLHSHFQWDDTKAAEEYRIEQARSLIRSVRVLNSEVKPQPVIHPVYYSLLRDQQQDGGGYRPVTEILKQASMRQEMIAEARRGLQSWAARYSMLESVVKGTIQRFEELLGEEEKEEKE